MAYCRGGSDDSTLYIYDTGNGICCSGCSLQLKKEKLFTSKKETLEHILKHIELGDKVPEHTLLRLRKEIKEEE